jgi:SAM-dependent methyltransferase
MSLSNLEKNKVIERYTSRYNEYGYSPKTLGWDKGKQGLRFDVLTSEMDLHNRTVLDIGCGFGDLNKILSAKFKNYGYTGVDIVPCLIDEAISIYDRQGFDFICSDFLEHTFEHSFDYAIASGIFNFKIKGSDNYQFIEDTIKKSLDLCNIGIAFDFLSDKVDYRYEHTFHSSPEKILSIAYKYSRNVIFKNNYMPFEFSIFIFKDDSFDRNTTIFNKVTSYLEI